MNYSIQAVCASHIGKKRSNNEDNFNFNGKYMNSNNSGTNSVLTKMNDKKEKFKKLLFNSNELEFYSVYDGMGGGEYGELASFTSAKGSSDFFADSSNININDITPTLQRLCSKLNNEVVNIANKMDAENVGTTMVSLLFYNGQAWICNIGDSPCFILRKSNFNQISYDHVENRVVHDGLRKPYLTQYLGVNPDEIVLEPFIRSFPLQTEDVFLLCSDGLTDMVSVETIQNILNQKEALEAMVNKLIQKALDNGGRDNITIIICKVI